MIFHLVRHYRDSDVDIMRKYIRRKYGRFEKIKKLMQIKKCTLPGVGEAYLYYLSMQDGEGIEEEVIIEDRKVLNSLTAKRFELLEFLNKNEPKAIREISKMTGRDYKNVYDDVSSLARYFILNVIKFGRESIPVGEIEVMEIKA